MRFYDWQERLDAAMNRAKSQMFSYGEFDCALFAADCVQAITGADYAAELRGYDSKVAAYRVLDGTEETAPSELTLLSRIAEAAEDVLHLLGFLFKGTDDHANEPAIAVLREALDVLWKETT